MSEESAEDEEVKDQKGRVIVIAGPTGVGKTHLALALAKRLGWRDYQCRLCPGVCANFLASTLKSLEVGY